MVNILSLHAYPTRQYLLTSNVKKPTALKDIPNLLVLVQMFLKETLDLGFVGFSQTLSSDVDYVPL
jgi:hypothetical protein